MTAHNLDIRVVPAPHKPARRIRIISPYGWHVVSSAIMAIALMVLAVVLLT